MINVAGLWTVTFVQYQRLQRLSDQQLATQAQLEAVWGVTAVTTPIATPSFVPKPSSSSLPAQVQVQTLTNQLQVLEQRVIQLETVPTPTPKNVPTGQPSASSSREVMIFLGSGSSTDTSWKTIPGASVTINPAEYPGLSSVTFEAALAILGGEASARLVASTGQIFAQSTVSHNTSTSTWKTSPAFSLFSSPTTYEVQVRSSSGERVDLGGARLRLQLR